MATKGRRPKSATSDDARSSDDRAHASDEGAHDEHGADDALGEPDPGELEGEVSPDLPELDSVGEDSALEAEEGGGTTALVPTGSRSLARYDALSQYIQEVRRYPLLSREDEHELAVHYVKTGDMNAARRLITANLRLVIKLAHEYRQAHRNLLDLVQEGNVGLVQAVRKYDPYRGVKFSSYAAWWIRAYILKYILNNWRLVKIGTTQAQRRLFFNLRKEREKLEKLGYKPEAKLLAERLDVTEQEVTEMERRLSAGDLSLDAPVGREDPDGRSHMEMLEASGDTRPDVAAESEEFRKLLRDKFAAFEKTLAGREKMIFQERVHAETPLTLQEIGERYGISRERARQLEKRLTDKLRVYLRKELGDVVEIAMGIEE